MPVPAGFCMKSAMENKEDIEHPQDALENTGPLINDQITQAWHSTLWAMAMVPATLFLPGYWAAVPPAVAIMLVLRSNDKMQRLNSAFNLYSQDYMSFLAQSPLEKKQKNFLAAKVDEIGERLQKYKNVTVVEAAGTTFSSYLAYHFIPFVSDVVDKISDGGNVLATIFTFTMLNINRRRLENHGQKAAEIYRNPDVSSTAKSRHFV